MIFPSSVILVYLKHENLINVFLGSLILFDLLVHQRSVDSPKTEEEETPVATPVFDLSQTLSESLDSNDADTQVRNDIC